MEKYAVITGASSGIGAEFARRLAARGYALVLVARRKERLEELYRRLGKKTRCEICVADLTQRAECEKLCEWLRDKDVEVFINNAGFGDCGKFVKTDLDKDLDMIRLNVAALHLLTKRMIGQRVFAQCGFRCGAAPGGAVYGDILRDKSLCYKPDARGGSGIEGGWQPGIHWMSLPGTGGYRVQYGGKRGICVEGNPPGLLCGLCT